jgi:hypothetical protein
MRLRPAVENRAVGMELGSVGSSRSHREDCGFGRLCMGRVRDRVIASSEVNSSKAVWALNVTTAAPQWQRRDWSGLARDGGSVWWSRDWANLRSSYVTMASLHSSL